jgi:hypothetical protein
MNFIAKWVNWMTSEMIVSDIDSIAIIKYMCWLVSTSIIYIRSAIIKSTLQL